ncbi:DUF983 domain-containing protein [Parvicella tangerina]|nr:DUF983 domain-containing protein [Parvicella tangerina]
MQYFWTIKQEVMLKGSRLYSIFKRKCPRCHEGEFFEGSYFKGVPKKECDKCHLKYEKEPGFFQGSYYVVYALGVASMVTFWVASLVLYPSGGFDEYMWITLGGMVLAFPFTYPLSKIIWANFFYHYDKDALSKKDNK